MIYVDTLLKILNRRNGGETKKCFSWDIGLRNRAVFLVRTSYKNCPYQLH